jgi:hypothetical protein
MKRLILMVAFAVLAAVPAFADEDYVSTSNGSIIVYNTTTGGFTLLGTNSHVVYGLGVNSGTVYANDNGTSSVGFYSVNTSTGALNSIGNISGATSGQGAITSLQGGGAIYYFDHSNNLFTIAPGTGTATLVGPLGFTVAGSWDIDFAPNGNLYGTSNGNFYQINTTTGAGTFLGSDGAQLQGLVAGDGGLYGFSGTNMYSINLTDGALTFVRSTPSGLGNFETGTEVPATTTTTPEPSALISLMVGLSLVGGLAFWSKGRSRVVPA